MNRNIHRFFYRKRRDHSEPGCYNGSGKPEGKDFAHTTMSTTTTTTTSFPTALVAGGFAGTCVDVALFPIDTIKTRLQSSAGFMASGGFRGIYNGLGAAAIGSAPGAALFFGTYESLKNVLQTTNDNYTFSSNREIDRPVSKVAPSMMITHILAASVGEAVACLVRVPTEVIKARLQTQSQGGTAHVSGGIESPRRQGLLQTLYTVWQESHPGAPWLTKVTGGLYRGYAVTLMREVPFAAIQFPLYEQWKYQVAQHSQSGVCTPIQAAACGSASGAIAAAVTTPLDVIKTRLMLGSDRFEVQYRGPWDVVQRTWQQDGAVALWRGLQPRVFWITLGGFVFFGAYEEAKRWVEPVLG